VRLDGTLITIAEDVKVRAEVNPADAYRWIGCESRMLAAESFSDEQMGAGQMVTVLYEVISANHEGAKDELPRVDPLKYQRPGELTDEAPLPSTTRSSPTRGSTITRRFSSNWRLSWGNPTAQ